MTRYRFLRIERDDDGVVTLTLDRPPVNALGRELVEDLDAAAKQLAEDAAARCLVIRSAGRHFCAGADLKERRGMSVDEVRDFVPRLAGAIHGIARIPFPTVAAVRGAAAGGGCELALACDLRVLSEDATIGLRETALAIVPGAGGTQRLARIAGAARAKRWILTARIHTAGEALRDGVADVVVPTDRLDREAENLARSIAGNGPVANRLAKRAIEQGLDGTLEEGLVVEWECYQGVLDTEDRVEALRAFAEKRPPLFRGR